MEAISEILHEQYNTNDDGTISVTDKPIGNALFNGTMDAFTGELRYGKLRNGKECYEGSFLKNQRHDNQVLVQNYDLPPPLPSSLQATAIVKHPEAEGLVGCLETRFLYHSESEGCFFHGTYAQDEPTYGSLVTSIYMYRGPFSGKRFHGQKGELIHTNFHYRGGFEHGFFHGKGEEICEHESYEYQGDYVQGLKHGMGTWKGPIQQHEEKPNDEDSSDQANNSNATTNSKSNLTNRYVYVGTFHCNQRQGKGMEWTTSGEVYHGEFLANRRHGYGYLEREGVRYKGQWRAGVPREDVSWRIITNFEDYDQNFGISATSNSAVRIYSGSVDSQLRPHGFGTMQDATHEYNGDWVHGVKHGHGTRRILEEQPNSENIDFTGEWRNNQPVPVDETASDGTLREVTSLFQTTTTNDDDASSVKSAFAADDESCSSTHERQRLVLKEAMEHSKESSLFLLTTSDNTPAYFTKDSEYFLTPSSPSVDKKKNDSDRNFSSLPLRRPHHAMRRRSSSSSNSNSRNLDKSPATVENAPKPEVYTYPNGDTYCGAWDSDTQQRQRHGYGVFNSKLTSWSYSGMFVQNQRQGHGIWMHPTMGKYEGDFMGDVPHGKKGTLILHDSFSYYGPFEHGLFHGTAGTFCHWDGTVYVGAWKYGVKEGEGVETSPKGTTVYRGNFANGSKQGHGQLLDAKGNIVYVGEWRNNLYNGHGILHIYNDNKMVAKWEGPFLAGQRQGYGILQHLHGGEDDPQRCEGRWHQDAPQTTTKWRIYYSNGTVYAGQASGSGPTDKVPFLHVIPNGFGTMKSQQGDLQVGTFQGRKLLKGTTKTRKKSIQNLNKL